MVLETLEYMIVSRTSVEKGNVEEGEGSTMKEYQVSISNDALLDRERDSIRIPPQQAQIEREAELINVRLNARRLEAFISNLKPKSIVKKKKKY